MNNTADQMPAAEDFAAVLRQQLPALAAVVNEKLVLDLRFDCLEPGCDNPALVQEYSLLFGRSYAALLELGLLELLPGELEWMKRVLTARGFATGLLVRMLDAWILAFDAQLGQRPAAALTRPLHQLKAVAAAPLREAPVAAISPEATAFAALLLDHRRRAAAGFLLERSGRSVPVIVLDIVQPALAEIGRRWERNEISVIEEHAATEVCRYALMRLYDAASAGDATGPTGLVGCVPGEEHEFGAWLVAAELERNGWNVCYAGRSVPADDLIRGLGRPGIAAGFLSVQHIVNLPAARAVVERIVSELPAMKIVLGGRAAVLAAGRLQRPGVMVVGRFDEADRAARELLAGA